MVEGWLHCPSRIHIYCTPYHPVSVQTETLILEGVMAGYSPLWVSNSSILIVIIYVCTNIKCKLHDNMT